MCSALCKPCLILFDLSLNSLWFNHFMWQSLAASSHCWKVHGTRGLKVGISMILWARPSFNPYLKISVVPRSSRLAWAFPARRRKVVMNNSRSSPCLSWVSFDQESCLSLVFPKASSKSCLKAVQWASSVSAVPAVILASMLRSVRLGPSFIFPNYPLCFPSISPMFHPFIYQSPRTATLALQLPLKP